MRHNFTPKGRPFDTQHSEYTKFISHHCNKHFITTKVECLNMALRTRCRGCKNVSNEINRYNILN